VVKKYADDLRAAVRAAGRDDGDLKIYAQALIITAPTEAEARAKHEEYKRHIDIEAALALLSGWTGVDFSRFPLDATIEYIDSTPAAPRWPPSAGRPGPQVDRARSGRIHGLWPRPGAGRRPAPGRRPA
jgi:alkanesulfonate monooxygenase SsuD/methylene tetrahydromethanopterin reductase-like flavin-dependent oxidoreductase (luciferase family)